MATLITLIFTDAADRRASELDSIFRRVIDRTFNCVSVDTDTSTSDTAVILASGAAGPGRPRRVRERRSTTSRCRSPSRSPATARAPRRSIEVHVDGAADRGAGQAGRQGDRQLTAGEDGRARRRPQLGPRGDGHRQGHRRPTRSTRRKSSSASATQEVYPAPVDDAGLDALAAVHARRRGAHPRQPGAPATRRAPCGAATSPTATCASTPTTRPDASPAPSVTSAACGCRRRRGWSRRSCSCW